MGTNTTEDDAYWESQHKKKSNRPGDTAFKQQRLAAWKPVLTVRSTIPVFGAIGLLFLLIGGLLYGFVTGVKEFELDYSTCMSVENPGEPCYSVIRNRSCTCQLNFTLTENWSGTVFLYYKLTNFYQNHRRYIQSRNDEQLRGSLSSNSGCSPVSSGSVNLTDNEGVETVQSRAIAPCGLIANSMFNDTLRLFSVSTQQFVNVTRRGIAWKSDHDTKFRNPSGNNLTEVFAQYASPPNWQGKTAADLDPSDPDNNGFQNEDFIVWMRTAALSSFRKLYRKIPGGLKRGDYTLFVDYRFPTYGFDGKKLMVITTISWLGGRNPFLGIAYLAVGSISVAVTMIFIFLNFMNAGRPSSASNPVAASPKASKAGCLTEDCPINSPRRYTRYNTRP